ncbi:MAG TPA: DNA repair helicase XPB [Roseiflexaceae bacterium]|nr:DNA repair helicase XPB [Roseiflexaceae bacterium]
MTTPRPYDPTNPLIVQSDRTLLLEVQSPRFAEAREAIAPFAELEKSPEYIHTYRITPLSLWNAAAAGLPAEAMVERLKAFAKYPVPQNVAADVHELAGRWGRLRLGSHDDELLLIADEQALLVELSRRDEIRPLLGAPRGWGMVSVPAGNRGLLKQALINAGWPAEDLAGYVEGEAFAIGLRLDHFDVRDYQREAADAFFASGDVRGGSGVVVLPPGAGKTVVGLAAMALVGQSTLILTTNRTSVNQWRRELLKKTDVQDAQIAEYTGDQKSIGPITISTYQMLTHRTEKNGDLPHLRLFSERDWGLIVYDEVHMLPAPVFRATSEIQARRRLGLTATLVREDGREADVFSLIGPKKYDVPWRDLEQRGWIAEASCTEVRVSLPEDERMAYATAIPREMYRIAAENSRKLPLARAIMQQHEGAQTLVIGQYIEQLKYIADNLAAPLITGKTPQKERERLFEAFRQGDEPLLVISKVGNFALDLPDAELLIQVSGTFGSRQEEAQRLGRILRPKADGRAAHFYTIVTRDTQELDFAHNRQLFLAEQGYSYHILDANELLGSRQ